MSYCAVNFALKDFCPDIEDVKAVESAGGDEGAVQNGGGKPEAVFFRFARNGKFADDLPLCGISLINAGSMRFRWNETNPNRRRFFSGCGINYKNVVPVELVHSKKVCAVSSVPLIPSANPAQAELTRFSPESGMIADGVISRNPELVPAVTVADCMPLYLFDPVSGAGGVVHSGWKGTGIVAEAINLAKVLYGAKAEDFCVVIGPCIDDCCYNVDAARAEYFSSNFGGGCVKKIENPQNPDFPFQLSLRKANLFVLQNAGVKAENVAVCTDCTSCSPFLGSHRRQTRHLPASIDLDTRLKSFTPMAAFLKRV